MGIASGWVGLSLGGFWISAGASVGERKDEGCEMKDEWTARKWESLRIGWACPCGGLWVSAGVSVGGKKG